MTAHLIPIHELGAATEAHGRAHARDLMSLTARLALLNAELQDFRRDLDAAIETPFGIARQLEDAEDEQRYDHDEDSHGTT